MQFLIFIIATLVGISTGLAMRRPEYIRYGGPTDLDRAFMTAGSSIRALFPNERSDLTAYCANRDNIVMDAGALPPPSPGLTLYHIALGRGTQNYTCPTSDPNAAPQSLGAVANLYNVTCLMTPSNKTIFQNLFSTITKNRIPSEGNPMESGHHYFTNGNSTATFNLHTQYFTKNLGISYSKKTNNVTAPTPPQLGSDGSQPVPWLKLQTIGLEPNPPTPVNRISEADSVGNVKEIYRVNTAGGAAPKTCAGLEGTTFTKQYAAEYWFWN